MIRFGHTLDVPARVELAFEQGQPVAVNGVPMSLTELTESLATIAEDHGIGHRASPSSGGSADLVVGCARAALAAASRDAASGVVCVRLHDGEHTVVSVTLDPMVRHS